MRVSNVVQFASLVLLGGVVRANVTSPSEDDPQPSVEVTASIGDEAIFNCHLDFPKNYPIPYSLTWFRRNETIYFQYGATERIHNNYINRLSRVNSTEYGKGSIQIDNIDTSDEDWYECKVSFPNRTPPFRNNGTLFHLTVNEGTTTEVEQSSTEAEVITSTEIQEEIQEEEPKEEIHIGAPQDLRILNTAEGYVLTWSPPKQGLDPLRVYVVRQFYGPKKHLLKASETNKTEFPLSDLEQGETYHFEVGTLSMKDVTSRSNTVTLHVPSFGKARIAVAAVGCILLVILVGAIIWYSRHRLHPRSKDEIQSKKMKKRNDNA